MTDKPSRYTHTREQTGIARRLRRTVSRTERRLWPHLRASKMGAPFRRQHPIGPYFADYCCVPLALVVEIDGHTHSVERDSRRDHVLAQHGFDVLHFSVQEIDENLEGVVNTIHREIELRLLRLEAANQTPT